MKNEILEKIKNSDVYKQAFLDSYGGVVYLKKSDEYQADDIIKLWKSLPDIDKESVDGRLKGIMTFLARGMVL